MNIQLKLIRNFVAFSRKQSEKIINDNTNSNFEALNSDLKKEVYEEYQKKVQKDSILKKFRREIFKREEISDEMIQAEQTMQRQSMTINSMLHEGSKQDITKYSKKIMDKLLNQKKIFRFRENSTDTVFSDYGDYSSYKGNSMKVEDRNLSDYERIEDHKMEENYYDFIESLPEDYAIKDQVRKQITREHPLLHGNMTISEYGKVMQKKSDSIDRILNMKIEQQQKLKGDKRLIYYNNFDRFKDQQLNSPLAQKSHRGSILGEARLSTGAMNTIYKSYLEGWTVRQISKRFGIMPIRTKFVIWARAQLFDQLVTKYGIKYLYNTYRKEKELEVKNGVMDYGLDLARMAQARMPDEIVEWNQDMVDAQRDDKEYSESLQVMERNNKFDSHEKVEVGTHGQSNNMYLLKEWMIFRGKGSDQYHLRNYTYKSLTRATKRNVKEYF